MQLWSLVKGRWCSKITSRVVTWAMMTNLLANKIGDPLVFA